MTEICQKNCKSEINPNNIWEGDVFNRKIVAEDFSKIITSITLPFVVSVNAPYGSGKSFFLERWERELAKDNITIFFNAWNCDFVKKPLIPFMYCFLSQLETQGKIQKQQKEDIKNALKSIGKGIIKTGTGGIIDPNELLNQQKYLTYDLVDLSLDEYQNIINNLQIFKDKISKTIDSVREQGKNIYIFIDELERCRPTFAIELLESIKHLFDIQGLVFILGIDRSQLKSTISNIYGADMDGEGYLRRFIDLELKLPQSDKSIFIKMLCSKFEIINKEARFRDSWGGSYDYFNEYFLMFSESYIMSLRDIEQCYTEFNIITKTVSENQLLLTPLLAFLLVLKHKNMELYNKLGVEYKQFDDLLLIIEEKIKPKINFNNDSIIYKWETFKNILFASLMSFEELTVKHNELEKLMLENPSNLNLNETNNKMNQLKTVMEYLKHINNTYNAWNLNIFEYVKSKLSYTRLNN